MTGFAGSVQQRRRRARSATLVVVAGIVLSALTTLVGVGPQALSVNIITTPVQVTAQVTNAPPAGAQHRVLVRCTNLASLASIVTQDLEFFFATTGTQTQTLSGLWGCKAILANVPGYVSGQDVAVDWAGLSGYFTWLRTFPSTQPTTQPTTSRPAAPTRPAVEVVGVDFGSQLAGATTAPRDAIVRNTGPTAFTVSRFETADPFAIVGGTCQQGPVQPGAECTLQVTARPLNATAFERTLTVEVQAAGAARAQATLRVQGSDVENFSVGGASFGTVNVGAASGPQTIPVVNVGSLSARLSKIAVSGPFQVAPGGTCEVNTTTLGPRAQCTVNVIFAPAADGAQTGALEITAISPSKDIVSSGVLNGTGIVLAGKLQLTPPVVDFGRIRVGATSPKQQVTVSNVGTAPVTITGVGFAVSVPANRRKKAPATTRFVPTDAGFAAVSGCKRPLPPGGSCIVTVTARPGKRGELTAQLQAVAAGTQGASQLKVVGFARSITATPSAVVLAPTPIGTPSAPSAPVIVTNTGDEPVVIAAVTLGGAQKAEMAIVSSDCPKATLAPNARCTFVVQSTPAGGGARSGTVTVVTATKEQAIVGVRWSAQAGALALNPPQFDFGTLSVGAVAPPQKAEVRNVGKVPVIVTRLDPSDAAVILVQGCVGKRLDPGQACGFTVAVRAGQAGPMTGGVAVTGSGGEKAGQRLRYVGVGGSTTVAPTILQPLTATLPPALVMRPATGEVGRPTTAVGTGFPANADVTLTWPDGVTAGFARTDGVGTFQKVLLPLGNLRIGPTTVKGTPVAGGAGAEAPYLLRYATFRPQGGNRSIVTRG